MGRLLTMLGWIVFIAAGIWGFVLCLGIVHELLGIIGVIVGLFLFPALVGLAPWAALLLWGVWTPLIVVYGGGILSYLLRLAGAALSTDERRS